jgi:hypothetical protein
VRRYRLVYAADGRERVVRVFAVGHRGGIHQEVAARIGRGAGRVDSPDPR